MGRNWYHSVTVHADIIFAESKFSGTERQLSVFFLLSSSMNLSSFFYESCGSLIGTLHTVYSVVDN